jgi:hypothetical protein
LRAVSLIVAVSAGALLGPSPAAHAAKPKLRVSDVTVVEAAGEARFEVRLSRVISHGVRVRFATKETDASADVDFTGREGRLTIPAGARRRTVAVSVIDDRSDEADETFALRLSEPRGARLRRSGRGVGTIVDDDPVPTLSISDAQVVEGDAGEVHAEFVVTRSQPGGGAFNWVTATGTASPDDYEERYFGVRTYFTPSQSSITLSVPVFGDLVDEPNETFLVRISEPESAVITDDTGVATIVDDD